MSRLRMFLATVALALAATTAEAGQTCEQAAPQAQNLARAFGLAERLATSLDESGAKVVMLGRVGQDLRDYNQRYSHIGFAYRDGTAWRVVHKLNTCGTDESSLHRQGLADFFMDNPYEYEAGFVAFTPDVQAHLLAVLPDNTRLGQLHNPRYSMLAYPWAVKYQQSNQWAIETLAMAEEPAVTDRVRAQAWLMIKGYEPPTLRISALKRLGARATKANIAFDDHPDDKRFDGRIETVTADSVFRWLQRSGLGSTITVVR